MILEESRSLPERLILPIKAPLRITIDPDVRSSRRHQ